MCRKWTNNTLTRAAVGSSAERDPVGGGVKSHYVIPLQTMRLSSIVILATAMYTFYIVELPGAH